MARPQRGSEGGPGALEWLAIGQGAFYGATGVWSLRSMETFQMVTGPQADTWLVKTVGVLVIAIGAVLGLAGWRRRTDLSEVALLATGSALGLAAIDIVYVSRGRISRIYLADGATEVAIAALWGLLWPRRAARG